MSGLAIGFSTSSPQTSLAIFSANDKLIWCGQEVALNAASGTLVKLLDVGLRESALSLADVSRFVADLGPGSFTGVRVGIIFAKVMAMSCASVAGATAFDLISPDRTVYVPSRKGELFIRDAGREPYRAEAPPEGALGYVYGKPGSFPHAKNFGPLLHVLEFMSPEQLVPTYLSEPSISQPKRPYGGAHV